MEKVTTKVDNQNKVVWLTIPKAEIQDVHVDTSDIKPILFTAEPVATETT